MAIIYYNNNLTRHVANKFHHLKKIKSKIQRKAIDVGFIKKTIMDEVTPTFPKVKG